LGRSFAIDGLAFFVLGFGVLAVAVQLVAATLKRAGIWSYGPGLHPNACATSTGTPFRGSSASLKGIDRPHARFNDNTRPDRLCTSSHRWELSSQLAMSDV